MIPWTQSHYNFPLSGDVQQNIETDWLFGAIEPGVGDGDIEKEIFLKVASYGRQIGLIAEIVMQLAKDSKLDDEKGSALYELKELQPMIAKVKREKREKLRVNAVRSLDRLGKFDEKLLSEVLKDYGKKQKT